MNRVTLLCPKLSMGKDSAIKMKYSNSGSFQIVIHFIFATKWPCCDNFCYAQTVRYGIQRYWYPGPWYRQREFELLVECLVRVHWSSVIRVQEIK